MAPDRQLVAPAPRSRSIGWLLLVIGLLTSMVIIGLSLLLSFRLSDRDAILDDMAQVMQAVSNETVENTTGYLAPAEREANALANLALAGLFDESSTVEADRLFFEILRVHDSFEGVFVGREDGSFIDVRRHENGPYRSKHIIIDDDGTRTVRYAYHNEDFEPFETWLDPEDEYEPKARPWFQAAIAPGADSGIWTDPYIFFSSQLPGVTRSNVGTVAESGEQVVIGIDIGLSELSNYISNRRASENGSSYILDRSSLMVAHPDKEALSVEGKLATAADLGDPVLRGISTEMTDLMRDGSSNLLRKQIDGTDYHVVLTPLVNNSDWVVAVTAPDDDFLGRVRDAQQTTRTVSFLGGVASLATLLAGGWVVNSRYRRERSLAEAALAAAVARSEERDVARQKLSETVDDLARSNADLEQYAYATAHDLRTPLRAMGGYAELLVREAEEADANDTLKDYAGQIVSSYERMCLTMDNLLEHARVNVQTLPDEAVPLNPIVESALYDFEGDIAAQGAVVEVGELPSAAVDPLEISRVFQNLISNAMRYQHPDRPCELDISGDTEGPWSVLRFQDNGIGIDVRDQGRVFELFRRLTNDDAGSGVGLALVKKIVEEHRGSVHLESELGVGSTFIIKLPTEPIAGDEQAEELPATGSQGSTA